MIEVIGLDEKDIDKAMKDEFGLPIRAPRDLQDGEYFWRYVGPAEDKGYVCPECGHRHKIHEARSLGQHIPSGEMVGPDYVKKAVTGKDAAG